MTYEQLFYKVKKEKGLNTDKTVKLFSKVIGRAEGTVKMYMSRGCPKLCLIVLNNYFEGSHE